MDFNTKWDWESFVAFNSKASESPRKMLSADWMIIDEGGENDAGSFNLSADGGNSGTTGSYVGHGSSTKSSISASTDSSLKDGLKQPSSEFEASANFIKKMEMAQSDVSGNSPPLEGSVGSAEPWISLKLRKRTYFENSGAETNIESVTTTSVMPTSSTTATKKTKSSGQNVPIAYCQVEGCNVDLSTAKEYHRKHKVCDEHSKCPRVIVAGVERRFCQQCSRFHSLSEFDEKKRSCRRRLSDHNARRRKPQQETIESNSSRLSYPFYDGRRHVNFLLNSPLIHPRTAANSTWASSSTSKFTLTRDFPAKSRRAGGAEGDLPVSGIKLPHGINMNGNTSNRFFTSKGPTSEVLNPGFKGPTILSNMDAAPEYRCALSLLSNNSWASSPESLPPHHTMHENDPAIQHANQSIAGGTHLTSSEFWLTGQQSTHPRPYAVAANGNFQEFQVFKAPYEADFYSNALN